ncbi:MAG: hypothetical protein OK439_07325 [Thaumarchaeota archaeon]|nr:hypothetical protein [Nitrososphaerota archaeon]
MDQNQIQQKFKQVSGEVENMASQMEQDATSKVGSIRDDAAKKFGSAIASK